MLTRAMQLQMLADLLAGQPRQRRRSREFQEPWRTCYAAIVETPVDLRLIALREALRPYSEGEQQNIIGAILATVPGQQLPMFPSLLDVAAELPAIRWLWPNWLPLAMLSLIGAAPGAGKSFVALDMARRVIARETWPDGAVMDPLYAGNAVLYIDAENVPQLINERAEVWGMDRRRLFLMLPDESEILDLSLERYRDRLVEMMHVIAPALVIVDSLSSISSRGENNIEDVRSLLSFLNAVAGSFECGMLLIHHLRKHSQLPLLADQLSADDFRGSGHIIAMARSVLGLNIVQTGPEPNRNGPRRLQIVKTNLAAYPEPIGCEFLPLHPRGVMLRWGAAPTEYVEPTKANTCQQWIVTTLQEAGGEMAPKELVALGAEAGFSRAMIYRAREEMDEVIENTGGRKSPENLWRLRKDEGSRARAEG